MRGEEGREREGHKTLMATYKRKKITLPKAPNNRLLARSTGFNTRPVFPPKSIPLPSKIQTGTSTREERGMEEGKGKLTQENGSSKSSSLAGRTISRWTQQNDFSKNYVARAT
jgi:hypothetical protein